jgi:two-component system LytT family response regulator
MSIPMFSQVMIVEDQSAIRKDLESLVSQQPGFIVSGSCGTVKEAIQILLSSKPDILLLDINLSDGTAFDILDKFNQLSLKFIFLTAHAEHAIKAIKANAIDYLLKPVDPAELKEALNKALNTSPLSIGDLKQAFEALRNRDNEERIVIRTHEFWEIVDLNNIIYCSSAEGYTLFILKGGKKIISSHHLKEYEENLPESKFLRPHQSYIVNISQIAGWRKIDGYLILKDGTEIPVSLRKRDIVNRFFNTI